MISVRDVGKRFGDAVVLDGASLDVARGEVTALMGPSGTGKSTLLRCLNGLDSFERGAVTACGIEVPPGVDPRRHAALLRRVRCKVGFVFQQFHLFPHLTVLENLIEAPLRVLGLPHAQAVERARRLLEQVGLPEKRDALPRHLSGGQQQRVAIARALAMEPEVVLFDEPTSALDPVSAADVLSLMKALARSGQTMMVVTHSTAFATAAASRVHILTGGKIVESGSPNVVLGSPRHPATVDLVEGSKP